MAQIQRTAERDAIALLEDVWCADINVCPLPIDPVQIAARLGAKTFKATLPASESGRLVKRAYEDPEIYLNREDHPNRRRFTCAHEVGHLYRRQEAGDDESWEYVDRRDGLSSTGANLEERYANAFAAFLLMPRVLVRRHKDRGVPALAARFGVSMAAMRNHLDNLSPL